MTHIMESSSLLSTRISESEEYMNFWRAMLISSKMESMNTAMHKNSEQADDNSLPVHFQRLLEIEPNGEPVLTIAVHFPLEDSENQTPNTRHKRRLKKNKPTEKFKWDLLNPLPAPQTN